MLLSLRKNGLTSLFKVVRVFKEINTRILGHFFPCTPGPFSCSTGLFVYHSHRAGPVLQEFGPVLRVGVRHSTSVLRPLPWG